MSDDCPNWLEFLKTLANRGEPLTEKDLKYDVLRRFGVEVLPICGPQIPTTIYKKRARQLRFKRNLQKAMRHYEKVGFRFV